jgi:hypothetical protein
MLCNYRRLLTAYSFHLLVSFAACRSISIIHGADVDLAFTNNSDPRWEADSDQTLSFLRPRQRALPEWLRILPLGASIVRGDRSNPEDGFRKPLRDHLRQKGYKVNMVGSQ